LVALLDRTDQRVWLGRVEEQLDHPSEGGLLILPGPNAPDDLKCPFGARLVHGARAPALRSEMMFASPASRGSQ
jgi:hypothetical protein